MKDRPPHHFAGYENGFLRLVWWILGVYHDIPEPLSKASARNFVPFGGPADILLEMTEKDDRELLAEYATHRSEEAFTVLVQRHVHLVYSVALRRLNNPQQAEEATQAVFVLLARKAKDLPRAVVLSGWLFQTARLTASNVLRGEVRRMRREEEASMQYLNCESDSDDAWLQMAPILDEALGSLPEKDRDAIVLRFFNGRSLAEVGLNLGVSEDAAKRRVARAVEKLRKLFQKQGVLLTPALIGGALTARAVETAPLPLMQSMTGLALASMGGTGTAALLVKQVTQTMALAKFKAACALGLAILVAGGAATVSVTWLIQHASSSSGARVVSTAAAEASPIEPEFEGRLLREWIAANPPQPIIWHDDVLDYRQKALRAMGKPGMSYLNWMLRHPGEFLDEHLVKSSSMFGRRSSQAGPGESSRKLSSFQNVVIAAQLIGPDAREMVPNLLGLWESRGNPRYGTYSGFPLALAQLGVGSPDVIASLRRHMKSVDELHGALCAFAVWRLNGQDKQAIEVMRNVLSGKNSQVHTRYALLDAFWRQNAPFEPFQSEIRRLIDTASSELVAYQTLAARAAWRLFKDPVPATALMEHLATSVSNSKANAQGMDEFSAAALDLHEVPGVAQRAGPILTNLSVSNTSSAALFAERILERLNTEVENDKRLRVP